MGGHSCKYTTFRGKKLYNQIVKPYLTNPRSVTDRALRRLRDSLADLGDLGGVDVPRL